MDSDATDPGADARTRAFFDRPPPEGYLEEWTERLAAPDDPAEPDVRSLLIFRLGAEWLALPTADLAEVTSPQPIHSIPHRSSEALLGLVNIRGQIRLCVSLHRVLGVDPAAPTRRAAAARMLILQDRGDQWVFPVEEVTRAVRLSGSALRPTPSTLRSSVNHTRSVFHWSGRTIGELDLGRLLESLRGLCA